MVTASRRLVLAAALVAGFAGPVPASAQSDPRGAWRLDRYTGGGSIGAATGQLMLTDGRFSLIYSMTGADGTLSARAHGGGYVVKDGALALTVEWSLDHVNGKGGVAAKPSTRSPRLTVDGDRLTLTYENGAVMEFRRVGRG